MDERDEQIYREMAEESAYEHMTGGGAYLFAALGRDAAKILPTALTPAERNGHGSDRRAAALGELGAIRGLVAACLPSTRPPGGDARALTLAALDRLEAIIRSMP